MQLGACTHREHAYMWVHTLGELLDHTCPEPRLLVPWSLPCASHVWGLEGCKDDGSSCIYGFGHGIAWPCSICGDQMDGDQTSRARGCPAQPQPSPEVPNSCSGVPLCQVCVLRGALPARPPS